MEEVLLYWFFDGYHISQVKCGNEITIWLLVIALQCGAQT